MKPLNWFWPFSASPSVPLAPGHGYMQFPTNGFEGKTAYVSCIDNHWVKSLLDPGSDWPPPDPDRMATYKLRAPRSQEPYTEANSQITLTQTEAMSRVVVAPGDLTTYDDMYKYVRFHR